MSAFRYDIANGLCVHDTCPWPLPPEDLWLCHVYKNALIRLSESWRAGQRKMFLVRLCYVDLTQGLPDFTVHDTCPWSLPPEDLWLCHVYKNALIRLSESWRAGQRKMFLVRLCYGHLTQGLPDFTVHNTCPWSLPPEDLWLCHVYKNALIRLSESWRAGQRKIFLVRLCYGDLTQVCLTLLSITHVHGPSHLRTFGYVTCTRMHSYA